MSSVDRYNVEAVNDGGDLFTESHKSGAGEWVRYEDHAAALAAEREKFTAEIDRLREKNRELNRREQAATRATADAKRCFDELQKNLGGATPWVGGSLGRALLGWQLRERTEEVQTLRDRLAKFAAFAGPDGEPMKVLGTLPITADGAIAIPFMSVVYHPDHPTRTLDVDVCQDEVIGQVGVPGDDCTEWHEYAIRDCYSTRTAAEAAKEKEPNK